MRFPPSLLLATMLPTISLALPTAAGSKHNIYLTHCQLSDCSLWNDCEEEPTLTAGLYFSAGPIPENTGSRPQKPTSLVTIYQTSWEGSKRSLRFGNRDGPFTSNISSGARTAAKGSIAGDGTLGTEPFVCFKDGTTTFAVVYDDETYTCTTDYWCPSIQTGTAEGV